MFIGHAGDEHKDYQMLERDFVAVGGTMLEITTQPKNVGSEALSAFMFHQASQPDPLDLLGAMFVIEGLGTKKAGRWAELLTEQLKLTNQQTSFLLYHGTNDEDHFAELRHVFQSGVLDMKTAGRVVKTAKTVARLYALQLEEIDHV
jgi:3-oxoacyl-[acyl-carrier-protein] synthase-3